MPLVATLHAVTLKGSAITWAVKCVSSLRRKFDPRPVPVGILMDEMALGQVFSPNAYAFSCQYYSTNAPYSFIPSFIHSFIYFFSFLHSPSQPPNHFFTHSSSIINTA
jgi:hypothetical protein